MSSTAWSWILRPLTPPLAFWASTRAWHAFAESSMFTAPVPVPAQMKPSFTELLVTPAVEGSVPTGISTVGPSLLPGDQDQTSDHQCDHQTRRDADDQPIRDVRRVSADGEFVRRRHRERRDLRGAMFSETLQPVFELTHRPQLPVVRVSVRAPGSREIPPWKATCGALRRSPHTSSRTRAPATRLGTAPATSPRARRRGRVRHRASRPARTTGGSLACGCEPSTAPHGTGIPWGAPDCMTRSQCSQA